MRFDELEKPRVGILGAGREGQAVWRGIRTRFPQKPLWLFAESAIPADFAARLDPALDQCHCGAFEREKLQHFDVLVRSAGVSPYRPELKGLRDHGVVFTSAGNIWFAENPAARTICITGTKGKSTTAALVSHLLEAAGHSVNLAGNIGRPMLDFAGADTDWWVIELSSYQLSDLVAEPEVAVLLNLSDEHIDWHGGPGRYRADKLRLADMARSGRLIANFADTVLTSALRRRPGTEWFNRDGGWMACAEGVSSGGRLIEAPPALGGSHNRHNLAAALSVIDALGIEVPHLQQAVSAFKGLPHRLQLLGEKAGIRYVDDSISTTPVSVMAALDTLGREDVVLLLGGLDRGLDWRGFARGAAKEPPYAIITMPDNGPLIKAQLESAGVKPPGGLHAVPGLAQAVALARDLVPARGCILLSPGAPSFPHFRDFQHRGDAFAQCAGIEKT